MGVTIKVAEEIVSCSDNGQHPLVYINLKSGSGRCQYCGQKFERTGQTSSPEAKSAA
ncbi:MAG TPA: zinc-finger domain-containing protein [Mariprofundaceae bacterium]|nr:zinc-finger domain-containing protein [Mariprofundaceae bacterium]